MHICKRNIEMFYRIRRINYIGQAVLFGALMCNVYSAYYNYNFMAGLGCGICFMGLLNQIFNLAGEKIDFNWNQSKLKIYKDIEVEVQKHMDLTKVAQFEQAKQN